MEYREIIQVLRERLGPDESREIIAGIEELYQKQKEAEERCRVLEGDLAEERTKAVRLKEEIAFLRRYWEPKKQGGRRGLPWEEK